MSKISFITAVAAAFIIAFCVICGLETAFAMPEYKNVLNGITVCIDAGHGGYDIGTQGVKTKCPESDINLDIALMLKDVFEQNGAEVVMTRKDEYAVASDKDSDMQKRADIIRNSKSDIMISIHQNMYSDESVRGPQVFYLPGSEQSRKLAGCVADELASMSGIKRECIASDLFILRSGAQPSIIAECGFLSNARDEELLCDKKYKENIARAIVKGTAEYFKGGIVN